MKDVTKRHFKNILILYLSLLVLFLIPMIIFIVTGAFIEAILFIICSVLIIFVIIFRLRLYLQYKQNTHIMSGTISAVNSYRAYNVVIKSEDKTYAATYIFISSHIKDKVGSKCTFILDRKGKAYIKDIE